MALGNIIKQRQVDIVKSTLTKLRKDLGRTITVTITGTVNFDNCPNCLYDPIRDESTGVYSPNSPYPAGFSGPTSFTGVCPICNGRGKAYASGVSSQTTTINDVVISDYLYTKRNMDYKHALGGNMDDVALVLTCDLDSDVMASGVTDITGGSTIFDQADYVTADGENYEVKYVSKSGLGELFSLNVYVSRITKKQ